MKFSDKKTCQIIIENLFQCVFPVLETFISSSLIKIVCKCNQIRGNKAQQIFQEKLAEKQAFYCYYQNFATGNAVSLFLGAATYIKGPKNGWLKTITLFIISQFRRLETQNHGYSRTIMLKIDFLKMWTSDQQHQHHLRPCQNC